MFHQSLLLRSMLFWMARLSSQRRAAGRLVLRSVDGPGSSSPLLMKAAAPAAARTPAASYAEER